jgi:hypothetical protein
MQTSINNLIFADNVCDIRNNNDIARRAIQRAISYLNVTQPTEYMKRIELDEVVNDLIRALNTL